jgi:hypothetical protein
MIIINKVLAHNLLQGFTQPVLNDFHEFIDLEIDELRKSLDFAEDIQKVKYIQGSIAALKKIKNIRKDAQAITEGRY